MPHPVLLLRGEHGTAKSTAARLLTSLIDRCAAQLRTAPRNVEGVLEGYKSGGQFDGTNKNPHWLTTASVTA